ncbi:hypothetical protein COLO4_06523 [Corchorus olitorius]|uniref:Uncharacterized protein n=1 Tax=Corchorus olitorius TaxID=93759 RepID=A0A1R3KMT4_9ROSI|nr:hypothetical protein COLO4_06523 [Corchorus olitorius]
MCHRAGASPELGLSSKFQPPETPNPRTQKFRIPAALPPGGLDLGLKWIPQSTWVSPPAQLSDSLGTSFFFMKFEFGDNLVRRLWRWESVEIIQEMGEIFFSFAVEFVGEEDKDQKVEVAE